MMTKTKYWRTSIEVFCDPNGKQSVDLTSANFTVNKDSESCFVNITTRHNAGCPTMQALGIFEFFNSNPGIAGLVLLGLGFVTNFFGGKFFGYVVTIVGGLTTFIITSLIFSVFGGYKAFNADVHLGWYILALLCFAVSLVAGLGVAFVTFKWKRAGASFFGFWVGFFAGYYFYALIVTFLFYNTYVAMMIIAASSIATAYYAFFWSRTLTVPATSTLGAYMMIRGFSMFVGGFPSEITDYRNGTAQFTMENSYALYMIAYVLLLVGGVLHQRYKKYHTLYDNDQFAIYGSINPDDDYMKGNMMN